MRNIVTQLDVMFVHDTLHELHLNKYKEMPLAMGVRNRRYPYSA